MLSFENFTPPKKSDSFLNGTTITGSGLTFLGIMMARDGLPSPANGSDAADEESAFTEMGFKHLEGEDVKNDTSCVIM